MKRSLALLWLAVLLVAALYLGARLYAGLTWRTDLLALLPRDAQDAGRQQTEDAVTRALSQRLVLLMGNREETVAHAAALTIQNRLADSGIARVETTVPGADAVQRLGALYAPFRRGLLSATDRATLLRREGHTVAEHALAQVYGFVGLSDARLLRLDPFLLLPRFFAALPLPFVRLVPVDGIPMLQDGETHWALVVAQLTTDPYALDVQRRLQAALANGGLPPGTQMLRLGAAFFAQAGAETALNESTQIGLASILGTVLLILIAYRALWPLWLSLLVITSGVLAGLAASLMIFGALHVATLLFGVSLIGVSVDYSMQYCTEIFTGTDDPAARLRRVRIGIGLGTATTVIGYLTLLLAPFPGLYQIATFSAAGLVAAWLTVVLWLPLLDRSRMPRHGGWMLRRTGTLLNLWNSPRRRFAVIGIAAVMVAIGFSRLRPDDDVRRMQSLSPALLAQQAEIRRLIGSIGEGPFLSIQAADDEAALRAEEAVADRLVTLRQDGALAGWMAPSVYLPSAARQRENRALVVRELDPLLPVYLERLGLAAAETAGDEGKVLTLPAALAAGAPFGSLVIAPGLHVMLLQGVTEPDEVAAAAEAVPGVTFVDPAGRFSELLGRYRVRAIGLLAVSAVLMAPLLVWRYGWRGGLRVILPPALAVVLAPCLRALGGAAFSFFDAMALILVLSIGVDYAIFCAETRGSRGPVTMLAVALAAGTALLSFGLLALSDVAAVHAFGATMTLGILLAFVLAPMAREPDP